MTKQRASLIIALCSLGLWAPLAWPLLTGRLFTFNDFGWFHLPTRYLYQQALAANDSLLWTPAMLSGFYIHGEGQLGLFHPFHQALYRLVPVAAALNLEFLANYVVMFAGTCWLLRRLQLQVPAALFGAMLFTFAGFNLLHVHHVNVIAVVAHMPWLLGAADVLLDSDDPARRGLAFAAVALILTSEHLLGFPQGVWWNLIAFGAFTLFSAVRSHRWGRLLACVAAAAISVLLGGLQVLPMIDASNKSIRPLLPPDFALTYSLHPANLLQLWSPYVFRERIYSPFDYPEIPELGIYSACVALVALPWLWIRRAALQHRRAFIAAALLFTALCLILALGRYGGIGALLVKMPGLQNLRAPVRYMVLVQFSLALLAAVAFDDLLSLEQPLTLPAADILVLCLPLMASVLTTLVVNTGLWEFGLALPVSTIPRAAVGTAIIFCVTVCVILAGRRNVWALPVLIVLTAFDLGLWGIRPAYRQPLQTLASIRAAMPRPRTGEPSARAYVDDPRLGGDLLLLQNYWMAWGYVALFPAVVYHHTDPVTQALSGAKWKFSPDGWPTRMYGVPRARLLDNVLVSDDLRRDEHRVDLYRTALVEHSVPPLAGPPGASRVITDRPGHIVVETNASGRQILSISERFHEGWSATMDGQKLQMVAVHHDFLGCIVEGGQHRVEFRFMPSSFVYGCMLSVTGAFCLAIGTLAIWRLGRRKRQDITRGSMFHPRRTS